MSMVDYNKGFSRGYFRAIEHLEEMDKNLPPSMAAKLLKAARAAKENNLEGWGKEFDKKETIQNDIIGHD